MAEDMTNPELIRDLFWIAIKGLTQQANETPKKI